MQILVQKPTQPAGAPDRARAGVTLIDVLVALTIVAISVLSLVGLLTTALQLQATNRETNRAVQAVRRELEVLRAQDFDELYAQRNANDADDPDGPGSAPGPAFDVMGLTPRFDDPDQRVGEVLFPEDAGTLREDVVDAPLGMPRDLDLDGEIDSADRAGDYRLLPVRVRVRWRGNAGPRDYEMCGLLREP